MKVEINESDFSMFYNKAREGFNKCINTKGNEYLQEEIGVPFESVTLVDASVKVVFSQRSTEKYIIEICIALHVSNMIVGKYIYYEDDKGNTVDDSLVFFRD